MLLSGNNVIALDWHGQQAKAEAGEYVLAVDPSARMVNGRAAGRQMATVQAALAAKVAGLRVAAWNPRSDLADASTCS